MLCVPEDLLGHKNQLKGLNASLQYESSSTKIKIDSLYKQKKHPDGFFSDMLRTLLQTRYLASAASLQVNLHLSPVKNPALPRSFIPDSTMLV